MISSVTVPVMVTTLAMTGAVGPSDLAGLDRAVDSTVVISTLEGHGAGVHLGGGRILTADHVLTGPARVTAGTARITTQVVFRDPVRDLALLQLDSEVDLPAAEVRDDPAHVGEPVYAAGAPAGSYIQVSSGIVSAIVDQSSVSRVQTDAAVNPGNSGGPLLDESGQVIGIVVTKSADDEGIGWATDSSEVEDFLADAVGTANGSPTRDRSADDDPVPSTPARTSGALPIGGIAASLLAALGVPALIARRRRRRRPNPAGPVLDLSDLGSAAPPQHDPHTLHLQATGRAASPTSITNWRTQ